MKTFAPPTIFEVQGRGQFPLDMLRYDECYPVRSEDVNALVCRDDDRASRALRTVRLGAHKPMYRITQARWDSFGWKVLRQFGREPE
jgi:hypothetical protein